MIHVLNKYINTLSLFDFGSIWLAQLLPQLQLTRKTALCKSLDGQIAED